MENKQPGPHKNRLAPSWKFPQWCADTVWRSRALRLQLQSKAQPQSQHLWEVHSWVAQTILLPHRHQTHFRHQLNLKSSPEAKLDQWYFGINSFPLRRSPIRFAISTSDAFPSNEQRQQRWSHQLNDHKWVVTQIVSTSEGLNIVIMQRSQTKNSVTSLDPIILSEANKIVMSQSHPISVAILQR